MMGLQIGLEIHSLQKTPELSVMLLVDIEFMQIVIAVDPLKVNLQVFAEESVIQEHIAI
jgi:hypothetical protein